MIFQALRVLVNIPNLNGKYEELCKLFLHPDMFGFHLHLTQFQLDGRGLVQGIGK